MVLLVWVAAVVAELAAAGYQAAALARVREDLRELERRHATAAADGSARAASRGPSAPMFSGLYDSRPSPMDGLRGRQAVVFTALAAVLGVVSGGLMARQEAEARALAAGQLQELGGVRASQDSLVRLVGRLRDSLAVRVAAVPAAAPVAVSRKGSPPAAVRPRATAHERATPEAPLVSAPVLPPPPRFDQSPEPSRASVEAAAVRATPPTPSP